jgi:predicted Fe-Mo cluster-binding NifX family protein
MSRIALPAWEGRVSPVFDVARRVVLVDLDGRRERGREVVLLPGADPGARARGLEGHHVDVLICGAISQPVAQALASSGVTVVSGICGDVDLVLDRFLTGHLDEEPDLHLPGWAAPSGSVRSSCPRVGRKGPA